MEPVIPQPVLYTVVAGLCGAIVFMFRLVISHHEKSITDLREERDRLLKLDKEKDAIVDRCNRAIGLLVSALFFVPREFKKPAEALVAEVDEAEKIRKSDTRHQ